MNFLKLFPPLVVFIWRGPIKDLNVEHSSARTWLEKKIQYGVHPSYSWILPKYYEASLRVTGKCCLALQCCLLKDYFEIVCSYDVTHCSFDKLMCDIVFIRRWMCVTCFPWNGTTNLRGRFQFIFFNKC